MYSETTAIRKIAKMKSRICAVQGGSSAGKSVGVLMLLIQHAIAPKEVSKPVIISIVSESLPHLKKGMIRIFLDIMQTHKYYRENEWNKTDYIYTFKTGSKIEFFSVDQPDKVRGPRRDVLFINEANNVSFETFEQLEIRTNDYIFIDWNPTGEFWYDTEIKNKRTDYEHLVLTYKDNEALNPEIIKALEQRKNRKGWWRVFGEGLLGEVEGKIYQDWQIIDEVPYEARLERYGLDFGYTTDPATIIAVYYYNGGYILDEVFYQAEAKNRDIASFLKNQAHALVIADSAEPKSIAEIKEFGVTIIPAVKKQVGKSHWKRYAIKAVQEQKISVTRSSTHLLDEYRKYCWKTDKFGVVINGVAEDGNDHCLDAVLYSMNSLVPIIRQRELAASIPQYWTKEKERTPYR